MKSKTPHFIIAANLLLFTLNAKAVCYCREPIDPTIPNGTYAESYKMQSASREVESYIEEMEQYHQCLVKCAQRANTKAAEVVEEWNASLKRYNKR